MLLSCRLDYGAPGARGQVQARVYSNAAARQLFNVGKPINGFPLEALLDNVPRGEGFSRSLNRSASPARQWRR